MKLLHPYLIFDGQCEAAFEFYRSVFGGSFSYFSRFGDMPADGGTPFPSAMKDRVMHVSLPISKEIVLMGSDSVGATSPAAVFGNNVHLSITVDSRATADLYFKQLSESGTITMAMEQKFWGDYFGMCTDRFGIHWMISYNEQFQFPS